MTFWISSLLFWMATCYMALSFIEYFLHGTFMHQKTWFARNSKFMEEVLYEHNFFHHGKCFNAQHFDDREGECLEINLRLRLIFGQVASFWLWGGLIFTGFLHGVDTRLGQFLVMGGAMFSLSLLAHHQAWNMIHLQMHTSPEKRASWFRNSSLCLWLARYHFMHHTHPRVNFCIVCPGADWLMGTYSVPKQDDVDNMQKHGFYLVTV